MELTVEEMQAFNKRYPFLDLTDMLDRFDRWDAGHPTAKELVEDKKRRFKYWLEERIMLKNLRQNKIDKIYDALAYIDSRKPLAEISIKDLSNDLYSMGLRIKGE